MPKTFVGWVRMRARWLQGEVELARLGLVPPRPAGQRSSLLHQMTRPDTALGAWAVAHATTPGRHWKWRTGRQPIPCRSVRPCVGRVASKGLADNARAGSGRSGNICCHGWKLSIIYHRSPFLPPARPQPERPLDHSTLGKIRAQLCNAQRAKRLHFSLANFTLPR